MVEKQQTRKSIQVCAHWKGLEKPVWCWDHFTSRSVCAAGYMPTRKGGIVRYGGALMLRVC